MKYGKIEIGGDPRKNIYDGIPPAPPTEPLVPVEEPPPPQPMPPYYLTAYGIAVKNGFSGTETEWLESLKGDTGAQGAPGVGIYSIAKISGSGDPGETDTYGVYLADDNHTLLGTFDVYNGENGPEGPEGPEGQTGPAGADGQNGADGEDGEDGVSITGVSLTSGTHAAGTLDTYTISYSDGDTSTFQVYNGADGSSGGLPAVTAADNGKFLRVVNGAWAAATVPIYNGATS